MRSIPFGQMNRCIKIQSEAKTRGVDGSWKKAWTDIATPRAAYNWKSGRELFESSQETAVRLITWTIRYNSNVDEMCRVSYKSDLFDIVNIEEIGLRQYMVLHCVKKTIYQEQ